MQLSQSTAEALVAHRAPYQVTTMMMVMVMVMVMVMMMVMVMAKTS